MTVKAVECGLQRLINDNKSYIKQPTSKNSGKAYLRNANLSGAELSNTILTDANFNLARVTNADFRTSRGNC
ncbi:MULTISPECIES: pentapeptide repeat-containing protein [Nostocales]|uniref:pentapeptide repeat-containing protein n=1 Tax=Nostocales TaxID=1161 RepID=UPI0009073436|nr:pentapeptide repeat-containing protein [Anabaena sp. WA102]MBE9260446.1 pentapeptide repeat-containing protein [Dolichospermum sp. LEGE 00246]